MHIICLFVASIKDAGKKFQLANVKDVNYLPHRGGTIRKRECEQQSRIRV